MKFHLNKAILVPVVWDLQWFDDSRLNFVKRLIPKIFNFFACFDYVSNCQYFISQFFSQYNQKIINSTLRPGGE